MQDFHRSSILYCAFSSHRLRGAPSLSGDGRFGARSLLAQLQAHSQVAGHGQPAPGAPQRLRTTFGGWARPRAMALALATAAGAAAQAKAATITAKYS